MSQTKYSRRIYMERNQSGNSFYVGYDSLILFVIFVFMNAMVLFQYFQTSEINSDLIFIGIFQLLMGIGGFSIGTVINRDSLEIGMLNKRRINETYVQGMIFASIVIVLDMFIGMATQSEFSLMATITDGNITSTQISIPLTAGVVEEAFFSLTLSALLYKVFKEIFKGMGQTGEMLAIMMSAVFTAVFFTMIHLYVYRAAPEALIMMFINRMIYATVFLKYKNFSMIVFMHIFHNALVIFMG